MRIIQRRPRWGLICGLAAVAAVGWWNVRRSQSDVGWGRGLFLHEGPVRIVRVEDPVTLVVRALDGPAAKYNGDFRVRLLAIERLAPPNDSRHSNFKQALAISNRFVEQCPQHTATVAFDWQRFDDTETPLAFVFNGQESLNATLLESGCVQLVRYPGMPSKWMRELIKIADERSADRAP
jgi:endonuclease YncB( thermonuclease family)